jgi:hypothetical protein
MKRVELRNDSTAWASFSWFGPDDPLRIGGNGRKAREGGLRLKASVALTVVCRLSADRPYIL